MAERLNLPLTAEEIACFLGSLGHNAHIVGDKYVKINGFSDPASYNIGTAIWLGSSRYLRLKEGQTEADVTLLFCSEEFDSPEAFGTRIVCENPRDSFMALVEEVAETKRSRGVHPLAVIGDGVILGDDVSVGPHAVLEDGAVIGARTIIEAGALIRGCVTLGDNCLVGPNCSIGSDGFGFRKLGDGTMRRLPHMAGVVIHDHVEIGAGSVIDRGTFRDTTIGDGTKIDSLTLIGHNVQIGRDCLIIGGAIGGNTVIGDRCEVIHATTKNRIQIGNEARVGIGSVVIRDVPEGAECFGNPARVIKK